jgi:iron(III) transport system permease protein
MPPRREMRLLWWAALLITAGCLLPMIAVLIAAFSGGTSTITMLWDTVLFGYSWTTLKLVALVALGTLFVGTTTAGLVVLADFPGRRLFEVLLVLPLAMPSYVLAYAYTHLLDHPGIVQTTLRDVTGWGARDYWFPEVRSLGGAALMLVLVLYPYVYLLTRAALLSQSSAAYTAARTLGCGPVMAYVRVVLPLCRPAVAAGVLLAIMETIADFGTVSYFGVQTFATGIYQAWFSLFDRAAAAQLSLGLLAFALCFALLERFNRRRARFHSGQRHESLPRIQLTRQSSRILAWAVCAIPVGLGFFLPATGLAIMAENSQQSIFDPRYQQFLKNSVMLASIASVLTVAAALTLGYLNRVRATMGSTVFLSIARLGYAVPGGVIAVGLLVPFAAFDNAVDAWMRTQFGFSTGLMLTGSIWVLVMAYGVRFVAAAIGAHEGGQSAINPNLDMASRVLGRSAYGTLRRIHLPLLRPSLLTALLIVFVDVMKELPATLIMRPFNFDTLAVQAHRLAADERLEGAAVPSLFIAAVGLIPVILLVRRMRA